MIPYEWFRTQWVAVKTDDPSNILQPIGLSDFTKVDWEAGVKASVHERDEKLFVSPVIQGWVLFFGDIDAILERYYNQHQNEHEPEYKEAGWHAALARMSTFFPEVQLFMSYDDNWQYVRAVQGKVHRALCFADGAYEVGVPSAIEIRNGGTALPEFQDQCVEFLGSELPYLMAGIWSVNPLELDEPPWEWLRNSQGLLYNGVSDAKRETREWLDNWSKGFKQAYIEDKYGIEINRSN
jgi:hypothetical protein